MSITLDGNGAITGLTATGISAVQQLPAGSVIQVVSATTTSVVTINTATYTDTNLTASITPKFSTSKILVLIMQPFRMYNQTSGTPVNCGIQLVRNSSAILVPLTDTTGPYQMSLNSSATSPNIRTVWNCSYIDSPATTSSTTYKTQARRYDSNTALQFQEADVVSNTSTIVLMEIAA
jgi:hypothetical protein